MPKRSQSKSRSASRGRPTTKTPKSKSKSPTKKAGSAKKTPASMKKQQTASGKSRSRSASHKAHTAPAAQAQRGPRTAAAAAAAATAATTPVARPSRSRSRTRVESKPVSATIQRQTSNTVTATSSHTDERPRRNVTGYGSEVASAGARTARAVARSAQNAPWRVCGWVSAGKQAVVQKWRRSCLHRPSAVKVRRHFAHNGKWYISLIVVILLAVIVYKFQRQLLHQVREVQTQLADFVETQRNIFGRRVAELQSALREAKRKYLDESTQTTDEPPIVSKVTVSPQQQNQQRKTVTGG